MQHDQLSHGLRHVVVMQVNASKQGNKGVDADAVYRTCVEEGARDLAVIEALLQSSKQGSKAVKVVSVPSNPIR